MSVSELLSALVIAARSERWPKHFTNDDKWYVETGTGIQIIFDGYSLDGNNNENMDLYLTS